MTEAFDPTARLIVVPVEIVGPANSGRIRCAIDTGASRSMINRTILRAIGYDLSESTAQAAVASVSGNHILDQVVLCQIQALGSQRVDLTVLCHDLPLQIPVDGLLGLDFFRGTRLTVDFRSGLIALD